MSRKRKKESSKYEQKSFSLSKRFRLILYGSSNIDFCV
jgi:hypothetical protein